MVKKSFEFITVCVLLIFVFAACADSAFKTNSGAYTSEYSIGIIESTEQVNKSYIGFYDDSLEFVGELDFNLGSMGTAFDPAQVVGDKMYVVPLGIGSRKELSIILEFDLNTGYSREIEIGLLGVYSFFVKEDHVFATSTFNAETAISRTELATGEVKKVAAAENSFIEKMICVDDRLYVFSIMYDMDEPTSFFTVYDSKTLDVITHRDKRGFGMSHSGVAYADGSIYFTAFTKISDEKEEIPDNRLFEYNLQTETFSYFVLEEYEPANIVKYGAELWILHSNLVTGESYGISIFDTDTKTSTYIKLDEPNICQIEIRDERLYALSDSLLYRYNLKGNEPTLTETVDVSRKSEEKRHYYISSMFLNARVAVDTAGGKR